MDSAPDNCVIDKIEVQFHKIVRKTAHFALYLVLVVIMVYIFKQTGIKGFKVYMHALIVCVVYAVFDELHQTFVADRSGRVADVLIDTLGVLSGISMFCFLKILRGK